MTVIEEPKAAIVTHHLQATYPVGKKETEGMCVEGFGVLFLSTEPLHSCGTRTGVAVTTINLVPPLLALSSHLFLLLCPTRLWQTAAETSQGSCPVLTPFLSAHPPCLESRHVLMMPRKLLGQQGQAERIESERDRPGSRGQGSPLSMPNWTLRSTSSAQTASGGSR